MIVIEIYLILSKFASIVKYKCIIYVKFFFLSFVIRGLRFLASLKIAFYVWYFDMLNIYWQISCNTHDKTIRSTLFTWIFQLKAWWSRISRKINNYFANSGSGRHLPFTTYALMRISTLHTFCLRHKVVKHERPIIIINHVFCHSIIADS